MFNSDNSEENNNDYVKNIFLVKFGLSQNYFFSVFVLLLNLFSKRIQKMVLNMSFGF